MANCDAGTAPSIFGAVRMVPAPPLFTKEALCLLPRMCSRPSASSGFPGMLFWHVEQYQTMSTSAAKTRPHGVRRGGGISDRYTVYCVGRGFPVTGRGSVTGRGRSAAELDRTAVPHCGRKLSSLARRATRALLRSSLASGAATRPRGPS